MIRADVRRNVTSHLHSTVPAWWLRILPVIADGPVDTDERHQWEYSSSVINKNEAQPTIIVDHLCVTKINRE